MSGVTVRGRLPPYAVSKAVLVTAGALGKAGHTHSAQESLNHFECGLRQATASLDSVSPSVNEDVRQNIILTSDM